MGSGTEPLGDAFLVLAHSRGLDGLVGRKLQNNANVRTLKPLLVITIPIKVFLLLLVRHLLLVVRHLFLVASNYFACFAGWNSEAFGANIAFRPLKLHNQCRNVSNSSL